MRTPLIDRANRPAWPDVLAAALLYAAACVAAGVAL